MRLFCSAVSCCFRVISTICSSASATEDVKWHYKLSTIQEQRTFVPMVLVLRITTIAVLMFLAAVNTIVLTAQHKSAIVITHK